MNTGPQFNFLIQTYDSDLCGLEDEINFGSEGWHMAYDSLKSYLSLSLMFYLAYRV